MTEANNAPAPISEDYAQMLIPARLAIRALRDPVLQNMMLNGERLSAENYALARWGDQQPAAHDADDLALLGMLEKADVDRVWRENTQELILDAVGRAFSEVAGDAPWTTPPANVSEAMDELYDVVERSVGGRSVD